MREQYPGNTELRFSGMDRANAIKREKTADAKTIFKLDLFKLFKQGLVLVTIKEGKLIVNVEDKLLAKILGVENNSKTISNKIKSLSGMCKLEALAHYYKQFQEKDEQILLAT